MQFFFLHSIVAQRDNLDIAKESQDDGSVRRSGEMFGVCNHAEKYILRHCFMKFQGDVGDNNSVVATCARILNIAIVMESKNVCCAERYDDSAKRCLALTITWTNEKFIQLDSTAMLRIITLGPRACRRYHSRVEATRKCVCVGGLRENYNFRIELLSSSRRLTAHGNNSWP